MEFFYCLLVYLYLFTEIIIISFLIEFYLLLNYCIYYILFKFNWYISVVIFKVFSTHWEQSLILENILP